MVCLLSQPRRTEMSGGTSFLEANDEILEWFSKRALLAGENTDVNAVHAEMLQKLPGESVCFRSADCIPRSEEIDYRGPTMPVDFLNELEFPGLPLHETVLKVGAPIMPMRNLDLGSGLCNGARLLVLAMGQRVLKVKEITGDARNQVVLIPRVTLDHDDNVSNALSIRCNDYNFGLTPHFISPCLSYCADYNSRPSLRLRRPRSVSGICSFRSLLPGVLPSPVVCSLSRVTSSNKISILLPRERFVDRRNPNVVYRQVTV
jgi:hypothetical protein